MTQVTKPLLLNSTGEKINNSLIEIKNAIRGYSEISKPWSIVINQAQSSPVLAAMGGDTTSWLQYRAKLGRYLMTPEGKAYKLSKTNSKLMEDNETEVDETKGDIMVRIPRLYFKVTTDNDLVTLQMCEREFGEGCQEINEQWVGAYMGYVASGKLYSHANVNPTRNKTITQFWNHAQAKGTDWGLVDYEQYKAMMIIYLCEYLDLNSQACLGNGMTGTGDNWCASVYSATTGATAELGDDCGKIMFTAAEQKVGGASHVSLFGIEDPYGWFWTMVQGVYFGNSENEEQEGTEVFVYEGNRMPTEEELTTHPTGTYRQLTRPTVNGWLKSIIADTYFDVLAKAQGGSASSYMCDYNYNSATGQLLLWGGAAPYGSYAGLAYSSSNAAFSLSSSYFGSRLAYYGEAEIVNAERAEGINE